MRSLARDPRAAAARGATEVVSGDLTGVGILQQALAGVDTVFLLWPSFSAAGSEPVVDAITRLARRVVYLSAEAEVTGRTAHSFSEWAVEHANDFR